MEGIYLQLLTSERFRESRVKGRNNIIIEAESDRGRLLFCPAFRRLQQKAQVFSMEPNAAVRSRLTHSVEVAHMGRYISDQITPSLIEKKLINQEQASALVIFVETACLMHDIGNPPFGHFGEAAIREWFRKNGEDAITTAHGIKLKKDRLKKTMPQVANALEDFLSFDGNPQGLRVVTKLQRNSDDHGLNLTKTTIGSYLKYVRSSIQKPEEVPSLFTKKCGYFTTEKDIIISVWKQFVYNHPQRFPLAYIMEAADDIAYCISDLEDSIEKGLVSKESALKDIYETWRHAINEKKHKNKKTAEIRKIFNDAIREKDSTGEEFTYIDFRTSLNRVLARESAKRYIKNHDKVISGALDSLIPKDSPEGITLESLRNYCRKNIYCHESVQKVELAGYTAIYGILDHFRCLLDCNYRNFLSALNGGDSDGTQESPLIIEKKLLSLFPKNYIKTYRSDLESISESNSDFTYREWCFRAHLITDFLSGMTDNFATETYQTLSGMRL
ncbi:dGTPase [Halomonas sp. BC04]|uniref:dGTPase n=1 Tax=Halomonas sp. BC04 TaxID=1403540 RepID=UPI0004B8E376|nr:dGTPase [Halomonas sp. BC04]